MKRLVGTLCGIISAALFGLGGILAQPLLSEQVLTPQQIVLLRLLIGGAMLLLYRNLFFKQARKSTKNLDTLANFNTNYDIRHRRLVHGTNCLFLRLITVMQQLQLSFSPLVRLFCLYLPR